MSMSMSMTDIHSMDGDALDLDGLQLVTMHVDSQIFGLPILQVRDVFIVSDVTPVPLAPASVSGLFNLRGRVMTMLSMRALLGFPPAAEGVETTAIGIEWRNESYGLLVDRIGEVMTLPRAHREVNPSNLDSRWSAVSAGVHRLKDGLLVELSLDALFNTQMRKAA
jgi:purine-binding chemotaxis protein CheW